jgi:hydroxymethylbilane synthase
MVPAVGQGAIAVQCRVADAAKYATIFDAPTARAVNLERAFQSALGGGCQTALGVHATADALYFFHENIGGRSLPLSSDDLNAPAATAARVLTQLGLIL